MALRRSALGSEAGAGSCRTRPVFVSTTPAAIGGGAGGGGAPAEGGGGTDFRLTGRTGAGGGGGVLSSSLSSDVRPAEARSRDFAAISWSVKARFSSACGMSRGGNTAAEDFLAELVL